jgi:hypothetical protein
MAYTGTGHFPGAAPEQGLFVIDVASEKQTRVVDEAGYPGAPFLSSDGGTLAFETAADLDPTVGNEDLSYEIFVMDLHSGIIHQVTDTVRNNVGGPGLSGIDYRARTFLMEDAGYMNGLSPPVWPLLARAVPRRWPNQAPVLDIPSTVTVPTGRITHVGFRATDPDGDPLVFNLTRISPPRGARLRSEFIDHGDGTADLLLTPTIDQTGVFVLGVAAFDDAGGVATGKIVLHIRSSP